MTGARDLRLREQGAECFAGAALALLPSLEAVLAPVPRDAAGVRLHGLPGLAGMLGGDPLQRIAAEAIGAGARPVRAILFDKSARANWALGWHQDRTIAVRARADVAGFGPWTRKQGLVHVEPPFALLEAMVTMRVHLDDVPQDNAPLLVAPGSHRLGKLREAEIEDAVARCGIFTCTAAAGDVWLYATPILHASAASAIARRRRVLQVDFAAGHLPGGLEWAGL